MIFFLLKRSIFPTSQLGPFLWLHFRSCTSLPKLTSCLGFRATAFVAVSLSLEMLVERVLIVCITREEHKFCICTSISSTMYTNAHWTVCTLVHVTKLHTAYISICMHRTTGLYICLPPAWFSPSPQVACVFLPSQVWRSRATEGPRNE